MIASRRTVPAPPRPTAGGGRALAAHLLAAASLSLSAGTVILIFAFPASGSALLTATGLGGWVLGVSFPIVGWIVATKRSTNRMGWIFLGVGISQSLEVFATQYATVGILVAPGALPMPDLFAWIGVWAWAPGFMLLLTATVLLFPDGRPPTPRWRPVLWVGGLGVSLIVIPMAVLTWGSPGADLLGAGPQTGDAGSSVAEVLLTLVNAGLVLMLAAAAASVAGLIVRYRRSTGVDRAQLKWFVGAGVTEIGLLVTTTLVTFPWPAFNVIVAIVVAPMLPVAAGIAILRYRLYDIDRIVSRSVAYLLVTGVLAAVFALLVVAFQAVLAPYTESNAIAVAGSTLAVASLAQPLRGRIQRLVDRRFNRARIDADRVASEFSDRIRDQTDVSSVLGALGSSIDRAVEPTSTAIWIRSGGR